MPGGDASRCKHRTCGPAEQRNSERWWKLVRNYFFEQTSLKQSKQILDACKRIDVKLRFPEVGALELNSALG